MKSLLYFSIPLSILCFVCFTASGEYEFYAGGNIEWREEVVGFPFIWMMDGVNSLTMKIAIVPLALNFLIYFTVCSLTIYPFLPILRNSKRLKIGIPLVSVLIAAPWFLFFTLSDTWYILNFDTSGYDIILKNYHFTLYGMVG